MEGYVWQHLLLCRFHCNRVGGAMFIKDGGSIPAVKTDIQKFIKFRWKQSTKQFKQLLGEPGFEQDGKQDVHLLYVYKYHKIVVSCKLGENLKTSSP